MKKLITLSAVAMMIAATVNAQTSVQNEESMVKHDLKRLDRKEKVIKSEKKVDKKELRKLEGSEVSYQSKEAFYKDFGNIPVTKWVRGMYYDEATFMKDGQEMTAFYDYDSELVGTTTHKQFSDLPLSAQKYINKKYSDYSKGDVILFDDNEYNETDMFLYGSQFEDEDNYFVPLKKNNQEIILQVNMSGNVSLFKKLQ
jgi:hypothetical protein